MLCLVFRVQRVWPWRWAPRVPLTRWVPQPVRVQEQQQVQEQEQEQEQQVQEQQVQEA